MSTTGVAKTRTISIVRTLFSGRAVRIYLAVYGVAIAGVGISQWSRDLNPATMTIMSGRANNVADSIAVLDAGGPPLISSAKPYSDPWPQTQGQAYFQVGTTDDLGSYIYLPLLGHWFGTTSPTQTLKWLFLGCFGVLLALYPLLFYELLGSVVAAVLAPILVITRLGVVKDTDIYWLAAWCALLCIPALLLLWRRRWTTWSVVGLAVILVAASFSSSIRAEAGLGILISGLVLVLLRERKWRRRAVVALIALVAYFSIKPALIWGVERYRNHVLAAYLQTNPNYGQDFPSGHPFWHPAYLGLGYLPNPWGIVWNDTVAFNAAERADPGVPYLSSAYERTLRSLYLKILWHHPGFVLRTYWTKALVVIHEALARFLRGLLLLIPLLLLGPYRRLLRGAVIVALPTLALGFAPPVMTVPATSYALGWLGSIGLLWLLALTTGAAILARWTTAFYSAAQRHFATLEGRAAIKLHPIEILREKIWPAVHSRRLSLGLLVIGAVSVTAISSGVAGTARLDFYREGDATPVVSGTTLQGTVLATWSFPSSAAGGWTETTSGIFKAAGSPESLDVVASGQNTPELNSPPLQLPPGTYQLLLRGRVRSGGISVQILDTAGSQVAATNYYFDQFGSATSSMVTPFTLAAPETLHFTLANWGASSTSASTWTLNKATLVRTKSPAPTPGPSIPGSSAPSASTNGGFYESGASPLVSGAAARGTVLRSWSFADGLPRSWRQGSGSKMLPSQGALSVVTNAAVHAAVLTGPPIVVGPGIVRLLVSGAVTKGGLGIGAVDASSGAFIANSTYWYAQKGFATKTMSVPFRLPYRTRLRIVLWNWTEVPQHSAWTVRAIAVASGLGG